MLSVLGGAFLLSGPRVGAQAAAPSSTAASSQEASDQDLQLLRQDIRSKNKQLIAANLTLTDTETTKFWPVYDQYSTDLVKINIKDMRMPGAT